MKRAVSVLSAVGIVVGTGWAPVPSLAVSQVSGGALAPVAASVKFPEKVTSVVVKVVPPLDGLDKGEYVSEVAVSSSFASTSSGRTTVRIDPTALPPSAVGSDGVVDLSIVGTVGSKVFSTATSVRGVVDGSTIVWRDPIASETGVVAGSAGRLRLASQGAASTVAQRYVRLASTSSASAVRVAASGTRESAGARQVARAQSAACQRYFVGVYKRKMATVGTTYPVGGSTGQFHTTSSSGGRYGIAAGFSGKVFKAAGSSYVSSAESFDWSPKTPSTKSRSYKLEVEYRLYQVMCGTANMGMEWRPHGQTGGVGKKVGISRPNWHSTYNCVPVQGRWARNSTAGRAYNFGTGVAFKDVAGVDLSVEKSYSQSHTVSYVVKGEKTLCGKEDVPSRASKMMMWKK